MGLFDGIGASSRNGSSAQIAIDKRTAEGKHFAIGDTIGMAADEGVRRFKISGIATYGDA